MPGFTQSERSFADARRALVRWPGRRFSDATAAWLRRIAGVWGTSITGAFIVAAALDGIPQSPVRSDWQIYAQVVVLIMVATGGTLVWHYRALGASMITAGAVALGALAAVEHSPERAFAVALAFYVPGLLFWLDWQRTRSLVAASILAVAMIALLVAGGVTATRIYDRYFGPVQPTSALVAPPIESVEWIWAGGVTPTSATISARLVDLEARARLAISERSDLAGSVYFETVADTVSGDVRVVEFQPAGLKPDTAYHYAVVVGSDPDLARSGTFRTFSDDAFSFSFAFGSCASTGSNGVVYETIRERAPLFYLVTGDFFYANIGESDPAQFWSAYSESIGAPAQAELYRSAPVVYTWDDHDFGTNDADSTSPSKEAAGAVYRTGVPHYPLASTDPSGPIYQAFTVGRVRFIVTDTRSERTPGAATDDATKSMLGAEQKAWFKRELLAANGIYPLIVWVNAAPWIGEASESGEGWAAYATERQELADFIAANQIEGLVMLAGDAHMLAIDDGSNSDYSTNGGAGFPIFHAAALDRHGSTKGGPYSEGAYPGGGQFGLVTVNDSGGGTIEVIWSGRNWKNEEIVSYRFTVNAPARSP